ncbi:MAG: 50S ribosomal protein L30 [Bacillota bacterium]
MAQIKVTLIKSTIGSLSQHKKTIEALGLRKVNSSRVHNDTVAIRGMIAKVSHLIKTEEV